MLLDYLIALGRRLLARGPGEIPPFFPDEPSGGVCEPRSHRPGGRGSAIAVPEPDDVRDPFVAALGRPAKR
jgi:hypothetical protein